MGLLAGRRARRRRHAWPARELRQHPFDEIGYDADGTAHALDLDESTIFDILSADEFVEPPFLNQGELTAARALRHGDTTPLLRLAAEKPAGDRRRRPAS